MYVDGNCDYNQYWICCHRTKEGTGIFKEGSDAWVLPVWQYRLKDGWPRGNWLGGEDNWFDEEELEIVNCDQSADTDEECDQCESGKTEEEQS